MSSDRSYKLAEDLEGAQREAATLAGNIVVAAGAGSGKTTVLAARYVRLLAAGRTASGERVHARNVLVLTFTRKAAAEMYSRIYGALAAAASRADDPQVVEHLASCLADFSQAQISTFDSFAARVARSGSSRFGIAPDFTVDEERASRMASDLALSFILEHREDEAMRELVASAGLEGVRDEVFAALALRRMCISSPPDFAAFHGLQAVRLEEMAAAAKERILAMRAAALDYVGTLTTPTSKAWLDALEASPEDMGPEDSGGDGAFLSFLDRFAGLRKPGSNSHDEASLFLSDFVPAFKNSSDRYRDIAATRAAHPSRLSLYRLLDEFRKKWDEARRAEKTLTFRDVAQLASDVLETDANVLDHYRDLFRYVMIDEFQDDDELQKRVLFLLASRGDTRISSTAPNPQPPEDTRISRTFPLADDKLFFVGDEKQSIYLFRGADVSVFRRLAGELSARSAPTGTGLAMGALMGTVLAKGAVTGTVLAKGSPDEPSGTEPSGTVLPKVLAKRSPIALVRNFRSEPGVIDMINEIFPSVMTPLDPEAGPADFEARFEPLESRAATPGVEPKLVYLELPRRRGDSAAASEPRDAMDLRDADEAEAWEVARLVRDAVERGGLPVADRGTGLARPARYEDFAVLLRSTGNQVHFEKYFRLFDVPYGSENACGLFSEAVACDLYYALRLSLYPEDRNALAAYLRSPFAGLSDDALVCVLAAHSAATAHSPAAAPTATPADPSSSVPSSEREGLVLSPETRATLSERDIACWERGAETVEKLAAMADRAPICSCLSFLWFETGYRAALLLDPIASAFEEHFELLHSLAVRADARGECLSAFVAELEPLVGKPDKLEIELPRESSRGVRIMTIHKSKGLEFPVVIIPQANNVGQDWGTRDAWYWEEGLGPTFRPPATISTRSRNAFYEHAKENRAALVAAELKRLLYVALTRAESHIVVTATEPRGEDTRGRSFRSLLATALGLFSSPSPLAKADDEAEPRARRDAIDATDLPPFGKLSVLPSGALVGIIPERSDRDYYILAAGARRRGEAARGEGARPFAVASSIPLVERSVRPTSSSVSAIGARAAHREAYETAAPLSFELLEIRPELAAPRDLSPETWGSLVHAVLELRLGDRAVSSDPAGLRLSPALESVLAGSGSDEVEAKSRAVRLAEVFFGSQLGLRALAATERYVEMKVAIALRSDAVERAPGRSSAIDREYPIGGQTELDFGGPAPPGSETPAWGQSRADSEPPAWGQSRAGSEPPAWGQSRADSEPPAWGQSRADSEPPAWGQSRADSEPPAWGQSRADSEPPAWGQSRADSEPPAWGQSRARGTIDLAFVEDGRVIVVDYKTDSMIATGEHDLQVAAYKRAASEIFGLPAEAWVFYLYGGGRAILVDADGKAPRLEDAPEAPPSPEPSFSRPTNKEISL